MMLMVMMTAIGFVLGVTLTATVSFYVFGLLHAEAVRAVESYGSMIIFSSSGGDRGALPLMGGAGANAPNRSLEL